MILASRNKNGVKWGHQMGQILSCDIILTDKLGTDYELESDIRNPYTLKHIRSAVARCVT